MNRNGKVALITGATRGIGKSLALGLAEDGYDLALVARTPSALEALLESLQGRPELKGNHTIHAVDLAHPIEVSKAMTAIMERHGRIDLLANNAGVYLAGSLDLDLEAFERQLQVNLVAPFLFMRSVLPVMRSQGSGHVFNIASRAGKVGFAGDGGYVASKFGLVGFSESIYREFAEAGVAVTALCPGWTNTAMAQEACTPLPDEEMIQPSDLLETVRWLLRLSPSVRIREVVLECRRSLA